jgi:hypothetical protein
MTNTIHTDIEIGPTKLSNDISTLAITRYANNNNIALMGMADDGQPNFTATMNLEDLDDHHAFIKNYSENEGVMQALVDADLVVEIDSVIINQFGTHAPFVEFTNKLMQEIKRLG